MKLVPIHGSAKNYPLKESASSVKINLNISWRLEDATLDVKVALSK